MRLLLNSFGHDMISTFVSGTLAYVPDAARTHGEHEHTNLERDLLRGLGFELVELPLADTPPDEADRILGDVDGVYVAGGETFDLLWVLRSTGNDKVLRRHVLDGLPYIGCSAGSVIVGPSIAPASGLDDPPTAPSLSDYAGGNLPPYPSEVIADTVRRYGQDWPLVLLRDGQALLIDDSGTRLV